jgi:hypothetical protein
MFSCLLSARYVHEVDIWKKTMVKNKANQLISTWIKDKTIDCFVEPVIEGGLRSLATTEVFNVRYYNTDWVKITSKTPLRRTDKVTNIRPKGTSSPIWVEEELNGTPATWFNSNGSTPLPDPFGRVVEYRSMLERAEVQGSGN